MPEISCFIERTVTGYNRIIFIKFEKYFRVQINEFTNPVIISYNTLKSIKYLFETYILSLVLTINTTELILYNNGYYINSIYMLTRGYFTEINSNVYVGRKNLLNKCEPKRETSYKKIIKFIKLFNYYFSDYDPIDLMVSFVNDEIEDTEDLLAELEDKVYNDNAIRLLTGIKKKYGKDIYDEIRKRL
jgi:hypothetical protein